MTMQATPTAIRHELVVDAPIERAFDVFTAGYHTWNPPEHHIGEVELDHTVMEEREGGRWYEVGIDGSECDWGRVLAYEPPTRVVLAWMIGTNWKHDPDISRASEVEVRFTSLGDNQTRLELEHRHLDRHGDGWEGVSAAVGSADGWPGSLEAYKERAEQA